MFCSNCGAQNPDSTTQCISCGAEIGRPVPAAQDQPQVQQQAQNQQQYQQAQPGSDVQNEKVMAVIGYFIFFIPLLAAPNSKFARYHANQGLILLLTSVALGILNAILSSVIWYIASWGVWSVVNLIFMLAYLAIGVLGIIGIVNAAQNKMKPMPLIGGLVTIIK